jgi:acetyl-CoA acyltransferase 2
MLATKNIFIVGAKRTPFGNFGGKLKTFTATDLGVHSAKAALSEANLGGEHIDQTFYGNVIQSASDAAYISRHVALKSGGKITAPALTINRLCGSGFETVCLGAESILLGQSSITLCGGSENMSQSPMTIDGLTARWGAQLGKGMVAQDSLWAGLSDAYAKIPMGITAENLAEKYNITREDCDNYGLRSQQSWQKAHENGIFNAEIAPMTIKGRKGHEEMTCDESPRLNLTIDGLTKLKPVFKKDGVVTAGNEFIFYF